LKFILSKPGKGKLEIIFGAQIKNAKISKYGINSSLDEKLIPYCGKLLATISFENSPKNFGYIFWKFIAEDPTYRPNEENLLSTTQKAIFRGTHFKI
jgi:hypothetical protein